MAYARLKDAGNRNGVTDPNHPRESRSQMIADVGVKRLYFDRAIDELEKCRMVKREHGAGNVVRYLLLAPSEWAFPTVGTEKGLAEKVPKRALQKVPKRALQKVPKRDSLHLFNKKEEERREISHVDTPSAVAAQPCGLKASSPKPAQEKKPKPARQPNAPRQLWEAMRDEAQRSHKLVLAEPTAAEYANLARVVKHAGLEQAIRIAKAWVAGGDKWTKDARWPPGMLYSRWSSIASKFGNADLDINDPARFGRDKDWNLLDPVARAEEEKESAARRERLKAFDDEEKRRMEEDPDYVPY
jgi:hypothetical protein